MFRRILVIGTGGVGGVIAAGLTRAGHYVTAVTGNEAIAESIRNNGYEVREVDGRVWRVPPSGEVCATLPSAQPYDLAIVATKATTLAKALAENLGHLAPTAPFVVCQNGLPEQIAASLVGKKRVAGCVVVWGAAMVEPGKYVRTSRGTFRLGRIAPDGPDLGPLTELLKSVSPAHVTDNLEGVRWSKLAINCATSTLGAISGLTFGPFIKRKVLREIVLEVWTEAALVAKAAGIRMSRVSGLRIEKMALGPADRTAMYAGRSSLGLALRHAIILAIGAKYRRMRSSMLITMERGREPEVEYLNGEIVKRGNHLGVKVPVNTLLVDTIWRIARRETSPSTALLESLYDELKSASSGG